MNTETNFMSFESLTKLIEEHKKKHTLIKVMNWIVQVIHCY